MPPQRSAPSPAPLQGALVLLLAALFGFAFATRNAPRPACGPWVDWLADRLVAALGPLAAWALLLLLVPIGVSLIAGTPKRSVLRRAAPFFPAVLVLSILLGWIPALAGTLGSLGMDSLRSWFGPYGSWITAIAAALVSAWVGWRFGLPESWRLAVARIGRIAVPRLSRAERSERRRPPPRAEDDGPPRADEPRAVRAAERSGRPLEPPAAQEPRIREGRPTRRGGVAPIRPPAKGAWILPDVDLIEEVAGTEAAIERDEILETSRLLVQTLKDFGVAGKVGEVHPGPVVTRYEYEPAPGVRVSQIVSRIDDIALALRAESVRIVAPIPGKAAVGVEIPNRYPAMISLREILESDDFRRQKGPLAMALGREISGQAVFARLDTMPHLLVAGATGSGKSVCLNVLLISLLFRHTPEELRLLLIDPKRLELTPYDGIPSLVCPVVTDAKHATRMLEWLCTEMERRYRMLQAAGVKSLEGYRKRAAEKEGEEPLPYIVVVVDELADLMTTQRAEIEAPISRLAHMARAVGIHMIFATQRPSVDVLTGVVKANFPARIAFHVASRIDSRTILDAGGAEFLLGRGDMLFAPPGKAEAIRVHGAYCTEGDAERVASFLREQPQATPLVPEESDGGTSADPAREDEMFEDALRVVVRERQASVSFLQRRLKVGYSRAARLMDLLEAAGVVSPYDGSKARDVMVGEDYLEQVDADGSQRRR